MVIARRGEIWWADLPEARGSEPAYRRPVVIIQADVFNESRLSTVLAVTVTSNLSLARMRANIELPAATTGLPRNSVANLTQLLTIDKVYLLELIGALPPRIQKKMDQALRLMLGLE